MTAVHATKSDRQLRIPSWGAIRRLTAGVMASSQYRIWCSEAWTLVRTAYESEGGTERVVEAADWARALQDSVPAQHGDVMFPQHAIRSIRSLLA